jgi:hypothetical protein
VNGRKNGSEDPPVQGRETARGRTRVRLVYFWSRNGGIDDCVVDGGGEVFGEGGVAESVGTVGDFAGAVEDDDGGKSVDAEESVEAVGEYRGRSRFHFVEIGSDEGFVVIAIGGEEEDVFIAGKFGSDFFVERFERAARATPGGPKIHD